MPGASDLSFKAYEIEELADVYFFRPVGMIAARAARALHLTPTFVTVIAGLVGVAGGALLYDTSLALIGFVVVIAHSVLDSADGQLARMTGQESEFGRLLDGLAGFATHAAIYVAIVAAASARGAAPGATLVLAAALSNLVHAQMYDYHRSTYVHVAIKGDVRAQKARPASRSSAYAQTVIRVYETMEAKLAGLHHRVEAAVRSRSDGGVVRPIDRSRYRDEFYWAVRGWNLLGDNTRFYAVGVLAWFERVDMLFLFIVIPMNVAFALLWLWQLRADRRFLAEL